MISINQSINQSNKQTVNQSMNQSMNQPISQSVNQSINQLVSKFQRKTFFVSEILILFLMMRVINDSKKMCYVNYLRTQGDSLRQFNYCSGACKFDSKSGWSMHGQSFVETQNSAAQQIK